MDRGQCVKLSVHPSRGLADEKFVVQIQNCRPGRQLTLHSLHHCEDGNSWEAFGHYTSDATGAVNVSEDPCLGGTYSGVEAMGLMWSMRPVPGSKPGIRLRRKDVQKPMEVTITVYLGHQTEGFEEKVKLAHVLVERWFIAPGVQRITVSESNLTAALFLPPGPGPFPAILDLWGGRGQLMEYRASLLASHGFATLALDYLTPKITLETGKMVGNEYFEAAFQFLQQHPQVLSSKVAMIGLSFGTSMTLKLSAYSEIVKPTCAICISGSHVQQVEGSVEATFKYYEKNQVKARVNESNQLIWRDLLLPIPTDPAFKVDMGRIQCPVMLVVGEDDQNWPAAESAQDMKEMMEQAGNSHLLTVHSYPDTGHLIEPPYFPHSRVTVFKQSPTVKVMVLWGGQAASHCHAQEDAWKKMILFLQTHLFNDC